MYDFAALSLELRLLVIVLTGCLGGFLASIINILADKIEVSEWESLKQAFSDPRVHCPACGVRRAWFDMIPVISWIYTKGHCPECGTPKSYRALLVELLFIFLAPSILVWSGLNIALTISICLFVGFLALLAVKDAEEGYMPDSVIFAAVATGLGFSLMGILHPPFFAISGLLLASLFMGALVWISKRYFGHAGVLGGDIKMVAMIGVWIGFHWAIIATGIAAATAWIYCMMAARHHGVEARSLSVRFGPFLAIGAITSFWLMSFFGWKTTLGH